MRSAGHPEFRTSYSAVRTLCYSAFLVGVTAAVLRADVSWTEIRTPHFTVVTNADVYGYVVASRAALRLERPADAIELATRALAACDSDEDRARVSPLLAEARRRATR